MPLAQEERATATVGGDALLVLDDEPTMLSVLRPQLKGLVGTVFGATNGREALDLLDAHPEIAVAIIDQRMPEMTGPEFIARSMERRPDLIRIILTAYQDIGSLIDAINAGTIFRYIEKPWKKEEMLQAVHQGLEVYRLRAENLRLNEELQAANANLQKQNVRLKGEAKVRFEDIIGSSPALQRMIEDLKRFAPTDANLLVLGETGTGKELIARVAHYNSRRAGEPFLALDCGALESSILTSELFGHKRGAFTGAINDRVGLFEAAHRGTVFLDEIGNASLDVQNKLLRVLDSGEIRPVGANQPIRVDVRVVAATSADLDAKVQQGSFREDLLYRLNVCRISVPPLRERKQDLPELVAHMMAQVCHRAHRQPLRVSRAALDLFSLYPFPGNIRELANLVERASYLCDNDVIMEHDLPDHVRALRALPDATSTADTPRTLKDLVDRYESQLIRDALDRNNGNKTKTAEELGLLLKTLYYKLDKFRDASLL